MSEKDTFTYTARNPQHPEQALTYTLHGEHMTLQVGPKIEVATDEDVDTSAEMDTAEEGFSLQVPGLVRPLINYFVRHRIPPFHLSDVTAGTTENAFWVVSWLRMGGLRLAPVAVMMAEVDNPPGAQAFVDELESRKQETQSATKYPWLFDYWATWAVGLVASFVWISRKLRRDDSES